MPHGHVHQQRQDGAAVRRSAAPPFSTAAPVHPVLQLQRLIGNRAVTNLIQRKSSASAGLAGGPLEEGLADRIQQERGGGTSLDPSMRGEAGAKFNTDLSGVRVHTGEASAALSRQVGATAFTAGRDIFLGEGASPSDSSLMHHEITHTLQQGMTEDKPTAIGAADTEHEQAAETIAATPVDVGDRGRA